MYLFMNTDLATIFIDRSHYSLKNYSLFIIKSQTFCLRGDVFYCLFSKIMGILNPQNPFVARLLDYKSLRLVLLKPINFHKASE